MKLLRAIKKYVASIDEEKVWASVAKVKDCVSKKYHTAEAKVKSLFL